MTDKSTSPRYIELNPDQDPGIELVTMVASDIGTRESAFIVTNAIANGFCPQCVTAEVYLRLAAASATHGREHFTSDADFIADIFARLGPMLLVGLANRGAPEGEALH